ncbi:GAF domain-containing protein [Pelotalea chapellei]|uniref:histidine kinase n=1 Tax=Pelotalea chapellei TaxID=44671 RepID=A0ABS5UB01_9BACT|nr:GAF domain-containing protein [Pelotalea chapellei]MBT1072840.1 GAF domain-containing protein [Pelotalea chapellei]
MATEIKSQAELLAEVEELRFRLQEAEETLHAIRSGAVDALVVSMPEGEQIFTLQGAEHPYRVLVETMNEGAATLSPEGTILYCNRRLSAMLGVPLENLIGSQLQSYVAPAYHEPFIARFKKCTIEYENEEMALITTSGSYLPVLFSCSVVELGNSQGMSIVFTDISARKHAEEIILRLNRLYAVLSAINHAIVHTDDRQALFQEFCRVAVELGGFKLALVGLVDRESESLRIAASAGETAYVQGLTISIKDSEPEGMGPSGIAVREGTSYICNDFSKSTITSPWQEKARAHGIHSSATIAIKENQKVIGVLTLYSSEVNFFDAQQVELLQQMGSEISFALDNFHQTQIRTETEQALHRETVERLQAVEELSKKEQMLIHQSRQAALGEMIGNIAHQWRQPLNTLGLLVQQAPLFYDLGEVNKEFLEDMSIRAMKAIHHMSQTIDDFRNFFKTDKEKVVFNVKEVIEKTLSLMEGSFQGQHIEVVVQSEGDPVICGYPNEFSQVLLNILVNARDALTEHHIDRPRVQITVKTEESRGVVTISDNAGGIPDEIIHKIFDPYFTTKGPQAGTGVGLFMSNTIIRKNMGGQLSVRNVERGAEFRIEVWNGTERRAVPRYS